MDKDDDPLSKLKNQKMVSCRICKGDHWTTRCPYKDTLAPLQDVLDTDKKKEDTGADGAGADGAAPTARLGKYVPPNMRDGGNKRGETMTPGRGGRGNEYFTNLLFWFWHIFGFLKHV